MQNGITNNKTTIVCRSVFVKTLSLNAKVTNSFILGVIAMSIILVRRLE